MHCIKIIQTTGKLVSGFFWEKLNSLKLNHINCNLLQLEMSDLVILEAPTMVNANVLLLGA
jgi:hypothetical protein